MRLSDTYAISVLSHLAATARRFLALAAPGSTDSDLAASSSLLDAIEIFFRLPMTWIWSSLLCIGEGRKKNKGEFSGGFRAILNIVKHTLTELTSSLATSVKCKSFVKIYLILTYHLLYPLSSLGRPLWAWLKLRCHITSTPRPSFQINKQNSQNMNIIRSHYIWLCLLLLGTIMYLIRWKGLINKRLK